MGFPSMSFFSELSDPNRKEFLQLYAQLEDFLRSAGFNEDGSFSNVVVNNVTIQANPEVPGGGAGGIDVLPPAGTSGPATPFTGAAPGDNDEIIFNKAGQLGADEHWTFDRVIQQVKMRGAATPIYAPFVVVSDDLSGVVGFYAENDGYAQLEFGGENYNGTDVARTTQVLFTDSDPLGGTAEFALYPNQTANMPATYSDFYGLLIDTGSASPNIALSIVDGLLSASLTLYRTGQLSIANSSLDANMKIRGTLSLAGSSGADAFDCNIAILDAVTTVSKGLGINMGDTDRQIHFDPSGFVKWT